MVLRWLLSSPTRLDTLTLAEGTAGGPLAVAGNVYDTARSSANLCFATPQLTLP